MVNYGKQDIEMASKGTINKRIISGNAYYYHQYLDDGRQVSRTISEDEAYRLGFTIYFKGQDLDNFVNHKFNCEVNYGQALNNLGKEYRNYKRRYCYEDIEQFFNGNGNVGKLLVLYGLRRTGKTTLMFQKINSYPIKEFSKVAYIKCNKENTIYQLFDDLKFLTINGFKYIFIDEITVLEDFVALSSTLSDIYGLMAKIVVSGTDSLGFLIASYHELFDRCKMVHTTYISFKEFSDILGNHSIDQYIELGGTMSMEGIDYNKTINSGNETVNEYVDSSIVHNIIHSIKNVDNGKYFFHLFSLYEKGELENAINRIIEDTNHRFVVSVIEREFKSHDYGSLKQLLTLPRNYERFKDVLKDIDEEKLVSDLMNALNIINKEKQSYKVNSAVLKELEEYLKALDVLVTVEEVIYPTYDTRQRMVFTQPGLRYSQAKALLEILLKDPSLKQYDELILSSLKEKLLSDVKGRMIEDIIMFETSRHNSNTFKIYFGIYGEYDMVTLDNDSFSSNIYEIKYSSSINEEQHRFLSNQEYNQIFEKKYYPIKKRVVLYRGINQEVDNVSYINIEEYLKNL